MNHTVLAVGLLALTCLLVSSPRAWAQPARQDVRVSPVYLSAVEPGLTITEASVRRWIAATELSEAQLRKFGFGVGTLDEQQLKKFVLTAEDQQARRFIEHYDAFGRQGPRESSSPRDWPTKSSDFANWPALSFSSFLEDAVELGQFEGDRAREFMSLVKRASSAGDSPETEQARVSALRFFDESRRGAVRRARGYKMLVDAVRKEIEGAEFVKSLALALEVGAADRQPTMSPLTLASLSCTGGPSGEIVFTQRQKDCSDRGVCKVELSAPVRDSPIYMAMFGALEGGRGRSYLDGCKLRTRMLIDGNEVDRTTSGRFVSSDTKLQR